MIARFNSLPDVFEQIGDAVKRSIEQLSSRSESNELVANYDKIYQLLDGQLNSYFDFDAVLIQEILENSLKIKKEEKTQNIPTYSNKWAYFRSSIHFFEIKDTINLNFFYFDRTKDSTPHLDEYSWLVHEIGHFIIEKNKTRFSLHYDPLFNEVQNGFILSSLASRSLAKEKSDAFQQQFSDYWSFPKSEEQWTVGRWPLELIIDGFCLWILGPAYIKVFVDSQKEMQGFILERSHPPVELRATALLQFSGELGWANEYTRDLAASVNRWQIELNGFEASKKNQYLSFKNLQLIQAAHEAVISFLGSLGIPKLKPEDMLRIQQAAVSGESLTATELLVAASLMANHFGSDDDAMAKWECLAITKFMEVDDQIETPVT